MSFGKGLTISEVPIDNTFLKTIDDGCRTNSGGRRVDAGCGDGHSQVSRDGGFLNFSLINVCECMGGCYL